MLVKPLRAQAIELYRHAYGASPDAAASAPACVDLIGGHTDYNGGPVLTIATGERSVVTVGPGEPGTIEGITGDDHRHERVDLREGMPVGWLAAVAGVLRELAAFGAVPGGARVAVVSDIAPNESRAALAVALTKAFVALSRQTLTLRQVAGVGFRAVSDGGKTRRGIMEHTTAALAHPNHALLIECASAATRRVPLNARVLLVHTDAPPDVDRVITERRLECEAAVLRLRMDLPELLWLASWPTAWLPRLKRALPQPLRSRAVHVVGETARTRFAAELLAKGRFKRCGELLDESHESCRRLFDASTPQADLVVAAARRGGALGARLSGGGSGGTVVVLLGKGEEGKGKGETKVVDAIQRAYSKACGREATITAVRPSGGVRLEPVQGSR